MNDPVFKMRPFCCGPACSLCSNQLGDKGTVALAEALTVNHTLLTLQSVYSYNTISFSDVLSLSQVIDSAWLYLKDGSFFSFSSTRLQSNSISNRGMTALTRALRMNRGLVSLK